MNYTKNNKRPVQQNRQVAPELALPAAQVATICSTTRAAFLGMDEPSADQVIVYPQSVQKDPDVPGFVNASVKIVKDYCGMKSHKIFIRFKVNELGNCLPNTIKFLPSYYAINV